VVNTLFDSLWDHLSGYATILFQDHISNLLKGKFGLGLGRGLSDGRSGNGSNRILDLIDLHERLIDQFSCFVRFHQNVF